MERLRLWLAHAHDKPRFRYGGPDFDAWGEAENGLDVGGQWFRQRRPPPILNEQPTVGRERERDRCSHATCPLIRPAGPRQPETVHPVGTRKSAARPEASGSAQIWRGPHIVGVLNQ